MRAFIVCLTLAASATLLLSPSPRAWSAAGKGTIVVGSKIDTEGGLLGKTIVLVLRANGFDVEDKTELGGTPILRQAILGGQIDVYPEYTGNGAVFFKDVDPAVWKDAARGYETVKRLDRERNNLVWLAPAPANNTWAVAVRDDLAKSARLRDLEALATYVNGGGQLKLAACDEFATRPDALPAFQTAYGFKLSKEQMVILAGCNTAQTEKAAAQGTSGVNAAMAYGTDGSLAALGLTLLDDPKSVQPVYEPAPVIRAAILEKHPELEKLLAPVFKSLDRKTLQRLNAQIAVEGKDAATVAEERLRAEGLLR